MKIHPVYGISLEQDDWVPAPRFLLRRDRVLSLMKGMAKGRLLEIGCGAGTLLYDFRNLGFTCQAVEISSEARSLAHKVHSDDSDVKIHESVEDVSREDFDYLCSFEVLEHIEDDKVALLDWKTRLKKGGHLLVSVPAHQRLFSDDNLWAGHFRRYEKDSLKKLLGDCGFEIVTFECYGFPLANLVKPLRSYFHGRQLKKRQNPSNIEENTKKSGVSRGIETRLYPVQTFFISVLFYRLLSRIQNLFLRFNLGEGFLVLAKKVD